MSEEFIQYAISFENGSSLFIQARDLSDAVENGVNALISCMPKDFDRDSLVRPTAVRRCGDYCRICGVSLKSSVGTIEIPAEILHSVSMKVCVPCARRVADAYEEAGEEN